MQNELTIKGSPPFSPTILIHDETTRALLTLNVEDGHLEATFEDDDLNEAAQIFVKTVVELYDSRRASLESALRDLVVWAKGADLQIDSEWGGGGGEFEFSPEIIAAERVLEATS